VGVCLLLAAHVAGLSVLAEPMTFYVSTVGRDENTGRYFAPTSDGQDGPLATLKAALVRARLVGTDVEQVIIQLRGGTYWLDEPLLLGPEDSGASLGRPLVIAAYPGEKPRLSGGRLIDGWVPVAGQPGRWQTRVAEVAEGHWYFRQLFVNGQRKQRARHPNRGYFTIQGPSSQHRPFQLHYAPGDLDPRWAADGDVEVVAYLSWADLRMQIRTIDDARQMAILSGNPQPANQETDARYYVENALDTLDAPGEWHLDRRSGVLTYWAEPGEDPRTLEVIAPRLKELIVIQGDASARKPVRHLKLQGLEFAHTDWSLGEQGYADVQSASAIRGALRAETAVDCRLEECVFQHLGGYGIDLGLGCQRWRIVGNELRDIGAGGIRSGEMQTPPEPFSANYGHAITDNHIHHLGQVYAPGPGIFLTESGQNRVAHNHIHHLYQTAIAAGWGWGYLVTPSRENTIEFNDLHDIGQGRLSDMGGVYLLARQPGTTIRNNRIYDIHAARAGALGLYLDEGSSGVILESNLVYRAGESAFCQHYGRENLVRNNIFVQSLSRQIFRTRQELHRSFSFTNNIICFDQGELLGGGWDNDNFVMDGNVYWDRRLSGTNELLLSGATLTQWRQRGHDLHSLVADPQFENPAADDFRLRPTSPALALGFNPLDLSRVGVRPKGQREEQQIPPWQTTPQPVLSQGLLNPANGAFRVTLSLLSDTPVRLIDGEFDSGDVEVIGGTAGAFHSAGQEYQFTVTPQGEGSVRVRVPMGRFADTSNQVNEASQWLEVTPGNRRWQALAGGLNGYVHALTAGVDGTIYVGGDFTGSPSLPSGRNTVAWRSDRWEALGLGMHLWGTVHALTHWTNGVMVAGGDFVWVDGKYVYRVATWRPETKTWNGLGLGMDGTVLTLAVLKDGGLAAAGNFTQAGGVPARRVAVWRGSRWSPLGAGFNAPVRTLAVLSDGSLVAGGDFTSSGDTVLHHLARWDGTAWKPMGTGVNGPVRTALVWPGGKLIIGGEFTAAGAQPVAFLAQGDGAHWEAVGGGTDGPMYALAQHGDSLVVGGFFVRAGGTAAQHIATWNGISWGTLGSGTDLEVRSLLATADGSLYVGGGFGWAGGTIANNVARWNATPSEAPLVLRHEVADANSVSLWFSTQAGYRYTLERRDTATAGEPDWHPARVVEGDGWDCVLEDGTPPDTMRWYRLRREPSW
jgi:hypothetical protein